MGIITSSIGVKVAAITAAVLIVLGGVGGALWGNAPTSPALLSYQAKRRAPDARIAAARQHGYTPSDLAPVTAQVRRLDSAHEPWWLLGRPGYFQGQSTRAGVLQHQLSTLEQSLEDQARSDVGKQADAAKAALAQAQQANAADTDVQSLQQRLDAVSRAPGAAHTLKDYRAA